MPRLLIFRVAQLLSQSGTLLIRTQFLFGGHLVHSDRGVVLRELCNRQPTPSDIYTSRVVYQIVSPHQVALKLSVTIKYRHRMTSPVSDQHVSVFVGGDSVRVLEILTVITQFVELERKFPRGFVHFDRPVPTVGDDDVVLGVHVDVSRAVEFRLAFLRRVLPRRIPEVRVEFPLGCVDSDRVAFQVGHHVMTAGHDCYAAR